MIEIVNAVIIEALRNEFGFVPLPQNITVEKTSDDMTRIDFNVNGKAYRFESHLVYKNGINRPWTGNGTITKIGVRPCEYTYGEE